MLMARAVVVFRDWCNYDSCEDREEYGIGRDVEIEINHAVKEYGGDTGHGTQGSSPDKAARVFQFCKPSPVKRDDHPG